MLISCVFLCPLVSLLHRTTLCSCGTFPPASSSLPILLCRRAETQSCLMDVRFAGSAVRRTSSTASNSFPSWTALYFCLHPSPSPSVPMTSILTAHSPQWKGKNQNDVWCIFSTFTISSYGQNAEFRCQLSATPSSKCLMSCIHGKCQTKQTFKCLVLNSREL